MAAHTHHSPRCGRRCRSWSPAATAIALLWAAGLSACADPLYNRVEYLGRGDPRGEFQHPYQAVSPEQLQLQEREDGQRAARLETLEPDADAEVLPQQPQLPQLPQHRPQYPSAQPVYPGQHPGYPHQPYYPQQPVYPNVALYPYQPQTPAQSPRVLVVHPLLLTHNYRAGGGTLGGQQVYLLGGFGQQPAAFGTAGGYQNLVLLAPATATAPQPPPPPQPQRAAPSPSSAAPAAAASRERD